MSSFTQKNFHGKLLLLGWGEEAASRARFLTTRVLSFQRPDLYNKDISA